MFMGLNNYSSYTKYLFILWSHRPYINDFLFCSAISLEKIGIRDFVLGTEKLLCIGFPHKCKKYKIWEEMFLYSGVKKTTVPIWVSNRFMVPSFQFKVEFMLLLGDLIVWDQLKRNKNKTFFLVFKKTLFILCFLGKGT